ncbi:MAG: transposase [Pseudomonadota bacterium]
MGDRRPDGCTVFLTYLRHCLVPTLRSRDIVVMDNLPAHKVADILSILEKAGAQFCYLPPYSQDLNPIEERFRQTENVEKGAAERTINGLQNSTGKALDAFSKNECANDFRHAGYA